MPTNNRVHNRVYDNEYFSGTQAALYIGDVFVDEITGYALRVEQTKTPIYGYASQLFDAVSKGPVLVTGSFSLNFKEANYLFLVLMRYKSLFSSINQVLLKSANNNPKAVEAFLRSIKTPEQQGMVNVGNEEFKDWKRVPHAFREENHKKKVLRTQIERVLNGQVTSAERNAFYLSLSGFASINGLDLEFEDVAEVLEDSVWGVGPNDFDDTVRRTDDNFFDGFDLYFVYGDYNNPGANHTIERVTGVHLTSRGKAVSVSGEPIQEEYQFIARNSF